MNKGQLELLVGDNAFHGISHLSQQRARERSITFNPSNVENATQLVKLSLQNGASGFMFSVSDKTLSILKELNYKESLDLYAIIPYAYEYVRQATKVGGISGLAKQISRQIIFSKKIFSAAQNLIGLIRFDASAFLKTYLIYEISRVKSASGKNATLKSVLLHEVITDMALALNLEWFFKSYISFFSKTTIRPGFETRNFPYLLQKLKDWNVEMSKITIASSFNKTGFQMNPSKVECENALHECRGAQIISFSVLAAGNLGLSEAADYIEGLENMSGVAVGVSKERHARETFRLLRKLYG
jgi:hypothetical protein